MPNSQYQVQISKFTSKTPCANFDIFSGTTHDINTATFVSTVSASSISGYTVSLSVDSTYTYVYLFIEHCDNHINSVPTSTPKLQGGYQVVLVDLRCDDCISVYTGPVATNTPTPTVTSTSTSTPTLTETPTPTTTNTPTLTETPTLTPTTGSTSTPTPTTTSTPTLTETPTLTSTPTLTETPTLTSTPTLTPTPTTTNTPTLTATNTPTTTQTYGISCDDCWAYTVVANPTATIQWYNCDESSGYQVLSDNTPFNITCAVELSVVVIGGAANITQGSYCGNTCPTPTPTPTSTPPTLTPTTTSNCLNCNNWEYNNVPGEGDIIFYYDCTTGTQQTLAVGEGQTGNFCNCDSIGNPTTSYGTQLTQIGICAPTPTPTSTSGSTSCTGYNLDSNGSSASIEWLDCEGNLLTNTFNGQYTICTDGSGYTVTAGTVSVASGPYPCGPGYY